MQHSRGVYPSYFFKGHDPILDYVRTKMRETRTTSADLIKARACSSSTAVNWGLGNKDARVRRPTFATVASVLRSMGVSRIELDTLVGEQRGPRLKVVSGGRR